jgi:hypothetical protein
MRILYILPVCLLAACSEGGGGGGEKKAEQAAASLEAGQWETSFEVTGMRSTDQTEPALKAAAGDKETGTACIAAGSEATPPPELFAGPGHTCTYKSSYIRNGRLNASLTCRRPDVQGEMMISVQGSYTGTSFGGTADTTTYLPGRGDFEMGRKITGRKTGPTCAAAEDPALEKSGAGVG